MSLPGVGQPRRLKPCMISLVYSRRTATYINALWHLVLDSCSPLTVSLQSSMKLFDVLLLFLLPLFSRCIAIQSPPHQRPRNTLTPEPIFDFTPPASGENLVVRPNGKVLITAQGAPDLYQIDPSQKNASAVLHSFSESQVLFGIVQLEPDVFYVLSASLGPPPNYQPPPAANILWRVDLTSAGDALAPSSDAVRVSKVVDVSDARTLDGLAVLNAEKGLLVTGDAQTGTVFVIDVRQGIYSAPYQAAELAPTNASDYILDHVGINGIKYANPYLYFSNVAKSTFGRVALSNTDGSALRHPCVLADIPRPDDLFIYSDQTALLTSLENGVYSLDIGGHQKGKRTPTQLFTLVGANALTFGSDKEACMLYVLFNQIALGNTSSGLVKVDVRGTGFKGGLANGKC